MAEPIHTLEVKVESLEKRRRNVPILHYAAGFFLLAKTLDYIHGFYFKNSVSAIPFFIVALVSLVYGFRLKEWDPLGKYNQWLRLLQAGFFVILGLLFLNVDGVIDEILVFAYGAICVYLYFTEKNIFEASFLELYKEGIVVPGDAPRKKLLWKELENVVARPDYITIFKEKNHYLQLEIVQHEAAEKLEAINNFAKQQIQNTKKPTWH